MTPNEVLIAGEEYLVPSNTIVPMTGERHVVVQYFCAADNSSNNGGGLPPPPPPPQQQQQQQRIIFVYSKQHEEPQQPRFVMMKVTALNKNTKYRSRMTQHQRTNKTSKRISSTQDKEAPKKKKPCRYGNSCRLHFLHGVCIFHHDDDDEDDKYMLMTTKKSKRAASRRGCNFGRACKGLACTGKDCTIAR